MTATEAIRKLEEMRSRALTREAAYEYRPSLNVQSSANRAAQALADLREGQDALAVAIAAVKREANERKLAELERPVRECQSVNHRGPRTCEADETAQCPYCPKVFCYRCEGATDDEDPFEDSCDDCWCALHDLYKMMMTGRAT